MIKETETVVKSKDDVYWRNFITRSRYLYNRRKGH